MRMRVGRSRDREGGAALVEFAVLAPLLLLLVLGIVEFGWLFGQSNAVRHATREASRYASVNGGGTITSQEIAQVACNDLLGNGGITSFEADINDGGGDFGDNASVKVTVGVESLSSVPFISTFLPSAGRNGCGSWPIKLCGQVNRPGPFLCIANSSRGDRCVAMRCGKRVCDWRSPSHGTANSKRLWASTTPSCWRIRRTGRLGSGGVASSPGSGATGRPKPATKSW